MGAIPLADDSSHVERERRALLVTAITIIIYNWAGGHFQPQGATVWSITVSHTWVIEIGVYVMFAIFSVHYWILTRSGRNKARNDIRSSIEHYLTFDRGRADAYLVAAIDHERANHANESVRKANATKFNDRTMTLFKRRQTKPRLTFEHPPNAVAIVWPPVDVALHELHERIEPRHLVSGREYALLYARAYKRSTLEHPNLAEFHLPILVAGAAWLTAAFSFALWIVPKVADGLCWLTNTYLTDVRLPWAC